MAIEKTPISEIITKLGLPKDSKYLGYVVHLPDENEFLAFCQSKSDNIHRAFSKTPELALKYKNYKKATSHARSCKQKAEVWLAFDVGNQIIVSPVDPDTLKG